MYIDVAAELLSLVPKEKTALFFAWLKQEKCLHSDGTINIIKLCQHEEFCGRFRFNWNNVILHN